MFVCLAIKSNSMFASLIGRHGKVSRVCHERKPDQKGRPHRLLVRPGVESLEIDIAYMQLLSLFMCISTVFFPSLAFCEIAKNPDEQISAGEPDGRPAACIANFAFSLQTLWMRSAYCAGSLARASVQRQHRVADPVERRQGYLVLLLDIFLLFILLNAFYSLSFLMHFYFLSFLMHFYSLSFLCHTFFLPSLSLLCHALGCIAFYPLCHALIDTLGLPHTLEHLVFCGSKRHPKRGYLDFLATRNLSQGTNAYTAEDHTSYQITTAGPQAMINVIPSFLDHVLHPTLHESVFTTEIYHLDGHGKHQGVVYNEMKARENSEADLMDLALRRMLFLGSTTYSAEAGGKTKDIKTLQNSECMEFHRQFYTPDQVLHSSRHSS